MPASATLLPSSAELTSRFDAVIAAWHEKESSIAGWEAAETAISAPDGDQGVQLSHRLALINTYQWHQEDRSRDLGADDTVLASVKRSIDASNHRRVQAIDALDEWVVSTLAAAGLANDGAPLPTESLGSIVDRLSILALKLWHVREACDAARDRETLAARLDLLQEQYDDLAGGYDHQQREVLAGRLRLKLYRQIKLYGSPDSA